MKEFGERYRNRILLICGFVLLVHGAKLNSVIIGIDTEAIVCQQKSFYGGWLSIGRQGLFFLKWLLDCLSFNPFFAGLTTLFFLAAAVFALLLLWDKLSGGQSIWGWLACAFLWIAHPVLTEQFYFSLQSMEICLGMLLMVLAYYLILGAIEKRELWRYAAGAVLVMITFSIYQVFVAMFIFGTVSVLILKTLRYAEGISSRRSEWDKKVEDFLTLRDKESRTGSMAQVLRDIVPWVSVFLAAFLGNSLITALFFSESEYLDGQVLWGKQDFAENLYQIFSHMLKVLTGYHFLYSSWVYGLLCLAGFLMAIVLWKKYGWVLMFYYVALMSTPFLMAIVCGSVPVARSQLVLPLMTGFTAWLDILMLRRIREANEENRMPANGVDKSKKREKPKELGNSREPENPDKSEKLDNSQKPEKSARLKVLFTTCLLGAFCLAGIWQEVQVTERLYYTDACRYAQDEALGRALIERLEPLIGEDDIPVVVLGGKPFRGNRSCVQGETIGKSFFDYDTEVEPRFYWSTGRILGFLHTLGYDCEALPANRIPYACDFAENLPVWPEADSVMRAGDMVIVKLGEYGE